MRHEERSARRQENFERKQCDAFHAFGPGLRGCLGSLLALFREGGRAPGLPHAWGGALRRGACSRAFSWSLEQTCVGSAGKLLALFLQGGSWLDLDLHNPVGVTSVKQSSFMFSRLYKLACHPTISRVGLADTIHFPFDQPCA